MSKYKDTKLVAVCQAAVLLPMFAAPFYLPVFAAPVLSSLEFTQPCRPSMCMLAMSEQSPAEARAFEDLELKFCTPLMSDVGPCMQAGWRNG